MSNKVLALAAVTLFILLGSLVVAVTRTPGEDANAIQHPSTYLAGPGGASGLAETLTRLGLRVERQRRSFRSLDTTDTGSPALLAVLDPGYAVRGGEVDRITGWSRHAGPVLLAGPGVDAVMECYGWRVVSRGRDSIRVTFPGERPAEDAAWVRLVLAPASRAETGKGDEITPALCPRIPGALDTILVTAGNRPVILRVTPKRGSPVYLASDGALFSNRVLRAGATGPFIVGLVAGLGPRVVFDEYHHGHSDGGDLAGELLRWSRRTVWGWSAWQLTVVGLLALVAAMVRFGPVRSVIRRTRRSPLEHVRALATALQAARGHDTAVELLVRGLRRRLSRDGRAGREPAAEWLASLAERTRSARVRAAAGRLRDLTRPRRSVDDVLAAANAVEDVWQELRP